MFRQRFFTLDFSKIWQNEFYFLLINLINTHSSTAPIIFPIPRLVKPIFNPCRKAAIPFAVPTVESGTTFAIHGQRLTCKIHSLVLSFRNKYMVWYVLDGKLSHVIYFYDIFINKYAQICKYKMVFLIFRTEFFKRKC